MDITVVNISKGPYELNKEALKDVESGKLSLNVTSRLRYSTESDYVGFQIDMMVMQKNTQVFKSGFLIGLLMEDWSMELKAGLDLNTHREKLLDICRTVWLVATGIVALQSSEGDFGGIILPSVNYEDFSKDVVLVPAGSGQ